MSKLFCFDGLRMCDTNAFIRARVNKVYNRSVINLQVTAILQKSEINRTPEECELLDSCRDIVKEINRR